MPRHSIISPVNGQITLRLRSRRGYAREAGGYAGWKEWQVVQTRKVVARFETKSQAWKWLRRHIDPKYHSCARSVIVVEGNEG